MSNLKITFSDEESKRFVLEAFDKSIDAEGFIVEKSTGERVLARDGEEITLSEFAGIRKGSEVFIKNDLASLIQLSDDLALRRATSEPV